MVKRKAGLIEAFGCLVSASDQGEPPRLSCAAPGGTPRRVIRYAVRSRFCCKRDRYDPQTASPGIVSLPWSDCDCGDSPGTSDGHTRIWMPNFQCPIAPVHSTHRQELHVRRYLPPSACRVCDLWLACKQPDEELQFAHHLYTGTLRLGTRTVRGLILRVSHQRADRQLGAGHSERAWLGRYDLGYTDWLHLYLTRLLHAQPCAEHHDPIVIDCDLSVLPLA